MRNTILSSSATYLLQHVTQIEALAFGENGAAVLHVVMARGMRLFSLDGILPPCRAQLMTLRIRAARTAEFSLGDGATECGRFGENATARRYARRTCTGSMVGDDVSPQCDRHLKIQKHIRHHLRQRACSHMDISTAGDGLPHCRTTIPPTPSTISDHEAARIIERRQRRSSLSV